MYIKKQKKKNNYNTWLNHSNSKIDELFGTDIYINSLPLPIQKTKISETKTNFVVETNILYNFPYRLLGEFKIYSVEILKSA